MAKLTFPPDFSLYVYKCTRIHWNNGFYFLGSVLYCMSSGKPIGVEPLPDPIVLIKKTCPVSVCPSLYPTESPALCY